MRKDKKSKINAKIVVAIIIILAIIVYAIYALARLIMNPTDTCLVENGKISLEESVKGYIIRDETVVKGENYKNGIAQIKTEGEKVAKGDSIFRHYTSGEESLIKKIKVGD